MTRLHIGLYKGGLVILHCRLLSFMAGIPYIAQSGVRQNDSIALLYLGLQPQRLPPRQPGHTDVDRRFVERFRLQRRRLRPQKLQRRGKPAGARQRQQPSWCANSRGGLCRGRLPSLRRL
jgi:hypothetical protein